MGQKGERGWGDRGKGFERKRKGREENEVLGNQRKGSRGNRRLKGKERHYREVSQKERRKGTVPY